MYNPVWKTFLSYKIEVLCDSWVVKMLACCAGGPVLDPQVEDPKFSKDFHRQNSCWMLFGWDINLVAPCISFYAGYVKDPKHVYKKV